MLLKLNSTNPREWVSALHNMMLDLPNRSPDELIALLNTTTVAFAGISDSEIQKKSDAFQKCIIGQMKMKVMVLVSNGHGAEAEALNGKFRCTGGYFDISVEAAVIRARRNS